MTRLLLKPVDTFFFKGHTTTVAGNDTVAKGIFPPRPNTVFGALRAAYIHRYTTFPDFASARDHTVQEWMGTPQSYGKFRQTSVFLMKDGELLLPLPLDSQVLQEGALRAIPLELKKDDFPSSNRSSLWRLRAPKNKKSASAMGKFIPRAQWKRFVIDGTSPDHLLTTAEVVTSYSKVGIHLNREKRQAEEHYLYQMNMLTMNDHCLLAVYADPCPSFDDVPYARLGAESRPWTIVEDDAEWAMWTKEELVQMRRQLAETKVARVILLSPAIWKNGSRPQAHRHDTEELMLADDIRVKVLTAAVGRPEWYGGWDIVKHRPKPRKPIVPAGTVLYVRFNESDIDSLMRLANGFTLTDEGSMEGFGFAVIAGVPGHS